MKKNISIVLIFTMLITMFFAACSKKMVENPTNASEPIINQNSSSIVEQESLRDRLIREIDGSLQKEDYDMMSTYEKGQIYVDYAKKWEQVADKCYNALIQYECEDMEPYPTVEEFRDALRKMKADWEDYYEKNMKDYGTTVYFYFGTGTGAGPVMCKHEYRLKMEWALQLVEICEMHSIDVNL